MAAWLVFLKLYDLYEKLRLMSIKKIGFFFIEKENDFSHLTIPISRAVLSIVVLIIIIQKDLLHQNSYDNLSCVGLF